MADILHTFPIPASRVRVYEMFATPAGLDAWWTARAAGRAALGETFTLWFGPDYDWRARVTACEPGVLFELEFTEAMPDWVGTRVRAELSDGEGEGGTIVRFAHLGWPEASEHFRVSSFCWAMYLRLLRKHLETGEVVPYEVRLDV